MGRQTDRQVCRYTCSLYVYVYVTARYNVSSEYVCCPCVCVCVCMRVCMYVSLSAVLLIPLVPDHVFTFKERHRSISHLRVFSRKLGASQGNRGRLRQYSLYACKIWKYSLDVSEWQKCKFVFVCRMREGLLGGSPK